MSFEKWMGNPVNMFSYSITPLLFSYSSIDALVSTQKMGNTTTGALSICFHRGFIPVCLMVILYCLVYKTLIRMILL